MRLNVGDIVLTQSPKLFGRLIRFFERTPFEPSTKVSHTGIIVEGGDIEDAVVVESVSHTKRHSLWQSYAGRKEKVAIFRRQGLTLEQQLMLAKRAESYVGKRYGYAKIVAHFLDWTLRGAYVFRRLTNSDNLPICSWLVAKCYDAIGMRFGVPAEAAEPDDIWDYVNSHPQEYEMIRPLAVLTKEAE